MRFAIEGQVRQRVSSRMRHTVAIAFAFGVSGLAAACADNPLPSAPTATRTRITIAAQFEARQLAGAQAVHAYAGYALTSG